MPRKKTTLIAGLKGSPRGRSRGRQLVRLNQAPLRRKAATECSRAMQRLEKARAEWKRFEREDQPAYRRWEAATFGVLLSRVREVETLVHEKETLVREVDKEMYLSGSTNYRATYARVQRRRTNPSAGEETRADAPPPRHDQHTRFHDDEEELSEFEQELLFEEFLRTFLGMNPDRMSDRQYFRMFADFKAKVLGHARPEEPPGWDPEPELAPEPPKPGQSRVKELYRLLVRRLHPDTRADRDVEVSALWHEVQEAYSVGSIDRLEMLLAFTDIQSNTTGEHTTLFQMRAVLAELRRAYRALQRNLAAAKKDHAWNFARLKDRSSLEARVRREMESTLALQEGHLRELEALIARWSAPPRGTDQPPWKRKQAEFQF